MWMTKNVCAYFSKCTKIVPFYLFLVPKCVFSVFNFRINFIRPSKFWPDPSEILTQRYLTLIEGQDCGANSFQKGEGQRGKLWSFQLFWEHVLCIKGLFSKLFFYEFVAHLNKKDPCELLQSLGICQKLFQKFPLGPLHQPNQKDIWWSHTSSTIKSKYVCWQF